MKVSEPETQAPTDLREERLAQIQDLFPDAISDGKIDFAKLRLALGEDGDGQQERFSFTWAGKREAIRLLQQPSRCSLVPDKANSIDFDTSENIYIEGENLEVLKRLYKSYFGRVKMIYIDPPYNTGKDFIYPDNFADPLSSYLNMTGQADSEGNLLTSNPETSGRFHSSWLSMMYPRLFRAHQLLREDGVIFVSIDDHEVQNLRLIMNEIFGEENFIAEIVVQLNPRGRHLDKFVAKTHEYLVVYARDASQNPMYQLEKDERMAKEYNKTEPDGSKYRELELRNRNPAFNSRTRPNLYYAIYVDPATESTSLEQDDKHTVEVYPKNSLGGDSCWTWDRKKFVKDHSLITAHKTGDGTWRVFRKDPWIKADGQAATTLPKTIWLDKEINNDYGKKAIQDLFDGKTMFDFPKAPALIKKMLQIGTQPDDIVLDFFAGAGTTAEAVLELNREDGGNRKFICVQLPEPIPTASIAGRAGYKTISDLGRERIRRVIAKFKKTDLQLAMGADHVPSEQDLGFRSYKMVPSHFRAWQPPADNTDAEAYVKQLGIFTDPLIEGWKPEELIYEVLLGEGFSLTSTIEPVSTAGNGATVWKITDDDGERFMHVSLDDDVRIDTVKALNLSREDLFICRDRALDDTSAANLALQCRLKVI